MGQNQKTSMKNPRWTITGLQKSQRIENQTSPDHLDGFQNIGAKIEYQHHSRTGTLDEIQNLEEKKKEEED